jgi:hypothetical protein
MVHSIWCERANARIAELEAAVQREHDCVEHWSLRAEQAEAEVERLKFMNQHAVEWRYEDKNGEPNWTADESDIAELWTARAEEGDAT